MLRVFTWGEAPVSLLDNSRPPEPTAEQLKDASEAGKAEYQALLAEGSPRNVLKEEGARLRRQVYEGESRQGQLVAAAVLMEIVSDIRKGYPLPEGMKIRDGESLGLKYLYAGKAGQGLELLLLEGQCLDVEALVALEMILFRGMPARAGTEGIPRLHPPVMEFWGERVLEEYPRALFIFGQMLVSGVGLEQDVDVGYEFLKRSGLVKDLPEKEDFLENVNEEFTE